MLSRAKDLFKKMSLRPFGASKVRNSSIILRYHQYVENNISTGQICAMHLWFPWRHKTNMPTKKATKNPGHILKILFIRYS